MSLAPSPMHNPPPSPHPPPPRWQDFDTELSLAWEEVLEAMSEGSNRTRVADSVLTFGYFWYNLMPLARGTAGAGYTSVLSLLMAAGYDPQARIPANYQVGGG
jgi:hypothetical protein